jgi:hypothetical protein
MTPMGWVNWTRKAVEPFGSSAAALGFDLNSTRLRAMSAEAGRPPRPVVLDEPLDDLPLAVSLESRAPEVGRAALGLERRTPHLAAFDFLNDINVPRKWEAGRHALTASELLTLVIARLRPVVPRSDNTTLALPVYLTPAKVTALVHVMDRAKLPVRGSLLLPLALIAASDLPERRPSQILVIDCDDHAFTGSLVQIEAHQARLLSTTVQPRLNLRAWKDRLLGGISDRCVRVCRRDPRDSGGAEQALYEQIDGALDQVRQAQRVELVVRSTHWYQNLIFSGDDFAGFCAGLLKPALGAVRDLLQSAAPEPPQAVWLTHAAGRLPGLSAALHQNMAERTGLAVLPPDAGARAAVTMAGRWARDEMPRTHLDAVVMLPEAPARDSAPPQYRANNASAIRGAREKR